MKNLWLPDIYIDNMKNIKKNYFIYDFEELAYVGNNTLMYSVQLEVEIYCPMNFDSYPMNTHRCYFMLSSYKYDASILKISMDNFNFEETKQVSLLGNKLMTYYEQTTHVKRRYS